MVSVIIPNYNHAQYLDERIQSVLNQTYHDFEVIVLDDCSTDNSLDIINKYKDNPHITQIVVNEKNCGSPFLQWHKGFELAKGDIIWIAESDDKCEPLFLEKLIYTISQREDCVVAFCKMIAFDENGNEKTATTTILKEGYYKSFDFLSTLMSIGTIIVNASGAIFKKSAAMTIDNRYMNFKGAGDRMFWVEMAECGTIAYVDEPLNFFRQHQNNSTNRNYQLGINQREDKIILDYILKKGYITKEKYDLCRSIYIKTKVFPVTNKFLRYHLLKIWEPNFIRRFQLLFGIKRICFIMGNIFHKMTCN